MDTQFDQKNIKLIFGNSWRILFIKAHRIG